jgi:hypothetical protein
MGDYDFKPSSGLKLKGVKDKNIKKSKKKKPEKTKEDPVPAKDSPTTERYVSPKTEAERRFEEIQRQRVWSSTGFLMVVGEKN